VGVDSKTIRNWLSILESSFVVFKLPPYFENFGKRVIKSPKYYFTDSGLACHLLDIEKVEQVTRDPLVGSLFENLVVLEAIKARLNQGLKANFYFYRDSHGNEIDLLYKSGADLSGLEIKSSSTYHTSFNKGLMHFSKNTHSLKSQTIVYNGAEMHFSDGSQLVNFREVSTLFQGVERD
jgi:predicted AAA+ superfamily ATPase